MTLDQVSHSRDSMLNVEVDIYGFTRRGTSGDVKPRPDIHLLFRAVLSLHGKLTLFCINSIYQPLVSIHVPHRSLIYDESIPYCGCLIQLAREQSLRTQVIFCSACRPGNELHPSLSLLLQLYYTWLKLRKLEDKSCRPLEPESTLFPSNLL